MTDLRTRLVDALREHRARRPKCITCSYGHESDRHLIDVLLSLPGIAIVELPEAIPKGLTDWPDDASFPVGEMSVRVLGHSVRWGDSKYPTGYARSLAAALLAAANAAEKTD